MMMSKDEKLVLSALATPPKTEVADPRFTQDYKRLNVEQRTIVDWHLDIAGRIRYYMDLHGHLIDEFHHKKFVPKTRGVSDFKAQNAATNKAYGLLYFGRKSWTSFDTWPCSFKGDMDSILCNQLLDPGSELVFLATDLHYNAARYDEFRRHPFDAKEWQLEKHADVTATDRKILVKFRQDFCAFLDELIDIVNQNPIPLRGATEKDNRKYHHSKVATLHKERGRIYRHLLKFGV